MSKPEIILASTSPTRAAILRNAGIEFAADAPTTDEPALVRQNPHWPNQRIALELAKAKSLSLTQRHADALIIGADQTMHLGSDIIASPDSEPAARTMLLQMRGKTHVLRSALACSRNGQILWTTLEEAHLTMRHFTDEFIDTYTASIDHATLISPGSYRFEKQGIQLFDQIIGDYFTILGLPLLPLLNFLRTQGAIAS